MPSENNKRIFLNKIGIFEIIPNPGEGDCLFHAISQALQLHHNQKQFPNTNVKIPPQSLNPSKIRQKTVHFLTKTCKGSFLWKKIHPELRKFWKHYDPHKSSRLINSENVLQTEASTRSYFRKLRKPPENFKEYYAHRMSQEGEPGTVYELRAAANLYRFHFDYLVTLSPESSSKEDTRNSQSHADLLNADKADEERQAFICFWKRFQFYSCRNNACEIPRGKVPPASEDKCRKDLYTLSPSAWSKTSKDNFTNCDTATFTTTRTDYNPSDDFDDIKHFYLLHTRYSDFEGHWELIRPVYLRTFPVPLHQKICGTIYKNPSPTEANKILRLDSISIEIEAKIRSGKILVPQEDPDWPADTGDNFTGCLKSCTNGIINNLVDCDSRKGCRKIVKRNIGFLNRFKCFRNCFKMFKRNNKVGPEIIK